MITIKVLIIILGVLTMRPRGKRVMYNATQKQEFIEQETNDNIKEAYRNYFARIAKTEEQYSKDIVDMDTEELRDTITSLNIRMQQSRDHALSLLRRYVRWATLNGKTTNKSNIDSITSVSIDSAQAIRNKMFSSPKQLEEFLDIVNDANQPNRSYRDSLIIWLLYIGLKVEQLQIIRPSDMDVSAPLGTIRVTDEEYLVDEHIVFLWEQCTSMVEVEKTAKHSDGVQFCRLCDSDFLFRRVRGTKSSFQEKEKCHIGFFSTIITGLFRKYSEATGINNFVVSPLNVRMSGIYWQMYQREKRGDEISMETIAKAMKIDYNADDPMDLYVSARKWLTHYDDWKAAFGY
jgi:integrase